MKLTSSLVLRLTTKSESGGISKLLHCCLLPFFKISTKLESCSETQNSSKGEFTREITSQVL